MATFDITLRDNGSNNFDIQLSDPITSGFQVAWAINTNTTPVMSTNGVG